MENQPSLPFEFHSLFAFICLEPTGPRLTMSSISVYVSHPQIMLSISPCLSPLLHCYPHPETLPWCPLEFIAYQQQQNPPAPICSLKQRGCCFHPLEPVNPGSPLRTVCTAALMRCCAFCPHASHITGPASGGGSSLLPIATCRPFSLPPHKNSQV